MAAAAAAAAAAMTRAPIETAAYLGETIYQKTLRIAIDHK
jgi:hypothetical protein